VKTPQLAVKQLQIALKGMMKVRAKRVNLDWTKVDETLKGDYKAMGDTKSVERIQIEIDSAK
jgi:hypothetical protein